MSKHVWGMDFIEKKVYFPNKSQYVTHIIEIGNRNKGLKEKTKRRGKL